MAYARALVAGFELDNIDDLISFADAFGASRLRYELVPSINIFKCFYLRDKTAEKFPYYNSMKLFVDDRKHGLGYVCQVCMCV